MSKKDTLSLSIIVSVFNEQEVLPQFWETIKGLIHEQLNLYNCQVIFVNDGSEDNSQSIINKIILESNDIRVKSIEFSRNFGHEAAMIAGIDHSEDDMLICMDSDLQHPPEKIPEMINKCLNGSEIVLMERVKRDDSLIIGKFFSAIFYKIINLLSEHKFENNASDFFLISKNVANVLRTNFRERNRFLRGYIQTIGFNLSTVEFEAPSRFAGKSSYNFRNLFKLGFTAIFAFSNKPLKLSLLVSLLFFIFSCCIIVYSIIMYFFGETVPSGYTTIIIYQSIGFTILSFLISILSLYFGKSLSEIRDRPIYLVKNIKQSDI